MAERHFPAKFNRRYLAVIILFVLALYVVLPQLGNFQRSWHYLSHPAWPWVAAAIAFTAATYFSAAGTYYWLAFKPIKYGETVLVQLAVMFINRLLPGGVGALGGNYVYLHKKGHSSAQAGVAVTVNNLLGFIGHNLLFLGTLLFAGSSALAMKHHDGSLAWLKYGGLGLVILLAAGLILARRRLLNALKDVEAQLFEYRRKLRRLAIALASSMSLTLANVLCLYACAHALGIHPGIVPLFLIFSFGLSAGTVTPTPGGLGGFEAGLTAGFTAYGASGSSALAVALLYRLVSYWLPLAAGAAGLVICQRRRLL